MSTQLQTNRVQDCLNWLQQIEVEKWQSIAALNEFLWQLSTSLAFINEQMAVAKRILNKKKVEAYNSLIASSVANETYFAPSLAKDYISGKLEQEQYDFDLCERCSRAISHTMDAVRTAQSALKTEMQAISYHQ